MSDVGRETANSALAVAVPSDMGDVTIDRLSGYDIPHVTRVHQAAFPDSTLTVLGEGTLRRYYQWHMQERYAIVFLGAHHAEEGLLGFCLAGVFRGTMAGFLSRHRLYLAWRVTTRPWAMTRRQVRHRIAYGVKVFLRSRRERSPTRAPGAARPKVRSLNLLAIAVNPRWQRRGVGVLLMAELERIARDQSFDQMTLGVNSDNFEAIRFYERLGWEKAHSAYSWTIAMRKPLAELSVRDRPR
jgi:ribosomal protein S18 acetylase RimI-like enzyme